jgi:hypothetical protein
MHPPDHLADKVEAIPGFCVITSQPMSDKVHSTNSSKPKASPGNHIPAAAAVAMSMLPSAKACVKTVSEVHERTQKT